MSQKISAATRLRARISLCSFILAGEVEHSLPTATMNEDYSRTSMPLMATSLQRPLFLGGQSIHGLFFKPLCYSHFLWHFVAVVGEGQRYLPPLPLRIITLVIFFPIFPERAEGGASFPLPRQAEY